MDRYGAPATTIAGVFAFPALRPIRCSVRAGTRGAASGPVTRRGEKTRIRLRDARFATLHGGRLAGVAYAMLDPAVAGRQGLGAPVERERARRPGGGQLPPPQEEVPNDER